MKLRPKMAFILRVHQMTAAEAGDDAKRDVVLVDAGKMSETIRLKRASTRSLARRIRERDDYDSRWPRDRGKRARLADQITVKH
jgi:hypothetical protein